MGQRYTQMGVEERCVVPDLAEPSSCWIKFLLSLKSSKNV